MSVLGGAETLAQTLLRQIENNFGLTTTERAILLSAKRAAIDRAENCFSKNRVKHYWNANDEPVFNPYHSGQYLVFLYFLSRELSADGHSSLADRVYYLNKMLNSCDIYHEVELPDIFLVEHPVGTVLGRAHFSNYFVVQQNCTVGGDNGRYPVLGEFVWLFAHAMVLGNCRLGNNVFVSAGATIRNENVPDNTVVFGSSPHLILKTKPIDYFHSLSPFRTHHQAVEKER